MRFVKMHGIGNDYVYVDAFAIDVPDPSSLARRISDRHFGVGADGLILICPPVTERAVCRMEMYNADGSRGAMCGNGLRCVAKYVSDRGLAATEEIGVDTDSGLRIARVVGRRDGKAHRIEVAMGEPRLERAAIPLDDGGPADSRAVGVEIDIGDRRLRATAVSMGNPHVVVRVEEPLDDDTVAAWGPRLERHEWFPQGVNAEFVHRRSAREIAVRVWERGSGETLACGTGACAAVVAGAVEGWLEEQATVHLLGGDLDVRWDQGTGGGVTMIGPAEEVFSGVWPDRPGGRSAESEAAGPN